MKIKAIKLIQNEQTMYVFVVTAGTLYDRFDISRRKDNKTTNNEGYQRSFGTSRINNIKNYLIQEKGIIPNSILVNIDEGKYSFNEATNELTLNDETSIGFIIDGQHRVIGTYNANPEIILPVVATTELDVVAQAQLFIKINSTQKGVPTSLYLDLLDLTEGELADFDDEGISNLGERRAIEIAKRLNEESDNPFFEKVNTVGERQEGVSLVAFRSSLLEYVEPKNGKFKEYGFEQQFTIFKIYFKAIKATYLEQWETGVFFKSVVFGGIMKAMYDIFVTVTQRKSSFSTNNAMEILEKIKDFNFNSGEFGSGFKAQDNLAKALISALKTTIKDSNEIITIEE